MLYLYIHRKEVFFMYDHGQRDDHGRSMRKAIYTKLAQEEFKKTET